MVHRRFQALELALEYNSVEKLMADEKLERWAAYASRQKTAAENRHRFGLQYAR